jgi:FkbM family methyltransferase
MLAPPRHVRVVRRILFRLLHGWRKPHAVLASAGCLRLEFMSSSPQAEDLYANSYERRERSVLDRLTPEGATVLDIGANIGFFTCLLAAKVGRTGRVIAFEPHPGTFEILRRNVDRNGFAEFVQCRNVALSNQEGRALLHLFPPGKESFSSMAWSVGPGGVHASNATEVPTETLAGALGDADRTKPLVLKVDAEGHEYEVLTGGMDALRSFDDALLMVESVDPPGALPTGLVRRTVDLPSAAGFVACAMTGDSRLAPLGENLPNDANFFFLKGRAVDRARRSRVL